MNYYETLEELAENRFENFINFVRNDKNLLYEVEESELGETEVEVEILDENEGTEFLGRFCFDEFGNYVM